MRRHLRIKIIAASVLLSTVAEATMVKSQYGASARVHPSAQPKFQCLVNKIDASGYRIKFMTGYTINRPGYSWHPHGKALDIDQHRRNVAGVKGRIYVPLPRASTSWAIQCGLFAGANWRRNPDFGHFQLGGGSPRSRSHHTRLVSFWRG